ncbi:hypothetical protein F2P79_002467 [Pimephales promelas]|nr:hypothetical protein F2P79_002467 [Pimephales promelas]
MKMRVPESHRSIWIANLAAAVAGHGTLHHFSSSPGLFRQMSVCGWQRQGIYPLSPLSLLLLIQIWVRASVDALRFIGEEKVGGNGIAKSCQTIAAAAKPTKSQRLSV